MNFDELDSRVCWLDTSHDKQAFTTIAENLTKLCLFSYISDSNCYHNMKRGFQLSFAELKDITFKEAIWQHQFRIAPLGSLIKGTIYFLYFIFLNGNDWCNPDNVDLFDGLMDFFLGHAQYSQEFFQPQSSKMFSTSLQLSLPYSATENPWLAQFRSFQIHKYLGIWIYFARPWLLYEVLAGNIFPDCRLNGNTSCLLVLHF